jgi:hypothetical protein
VSIIQFVQSRITRGAMDHVALHRVNKLARLFDTKGRLQLCSPRLDALTPLESNLPFAAPPDAKLAVAEISLRDAGAFVNMHHRHHASPIGHVFSLGCFVEDVLVGAAIIGRPVARMLDDGKTVEITRLASAGIRNVSSKLLGAARREAKKRGIARVITYTLPAEGGTSLRAAGYAFDGAAGGGTWSRKTRQRTDRHPTDRKTRWVANITYETTVLTNSQSCTDVEAVALKKAGLGPDATVASLRRKTYDSHDLTILVTSLQGNKEITVTKRMLTRHQAAVKAVVAA